VAFIYPYPGEHNPAAYDLENQIADPERRIERSMEGLFPFQGATIVDIGAGGGYHACLYAQRAAHVFAIEPAPGMLRQLYARVAASGLTNVSIVAADAEHIPLRDNLADVVHARFAYFFGPVQRGWVRSCEPGITEALRILKPGGWFFIIDNAHTSGQFASFLANYHYAKGRASELQPAIDKFYARHGFRYETVESAWVAPDRGLCAASSVWNSPQRQSSQSCHR